MSGLLPLPPAGLCETCRHAEIVPSPRSRFLRCKRADDEPDYARYPALPVARCAGFEPADGARSDERTVG